MKNTVAYEWDYETHDEETGDILEHNHADKLSSFTDSDITPHLVLVRDSGNESNGLEQRSWAYVLNGQLPDYFTDSLENPTHKVPERFKAELARYLKATQK